MTALYINPFLSACEDLQSRIYKLLELDGLPKLRERYPDGGYMEKKEGYRLFAGKREKCKRARPEGATPVTLQARRTRTPKAQSS